jgi:AAA domain-containing protein
MARREVVTDPQRPPELRTISLSELLSKRFAAPSWVIPDLLPVGLTILAAPPKTGKSVLALGLVLRVAYRATGDRSLSGLYLSLDDPSEQRLQTRVLDILDGRVLEHGACFATSAATLDTGLCLQLNTWLRAHPDTRIVAIDALATVKAKRSGDDIFKSDYSGLKGLQELALDCGVAVLLVHHTRKMPALTDWVDRISGTLGIAAMADALWLLDRQRGATHERLYVTSRDAGDAVLEVPLDDLLEGEWLPSGEDPVKATFLIDQVLATITDAGPEGLSAKAVAAALHEAPERVKPQIQRLHQTGRLSRLRYGQYTARLYTLADGALSPGVERPHDNEGSNSARLYTLSEVPSAQAATGLTPLCKTMCDTSFCESATSPDGNGADAQQYKSIQPGGEANPASTNPYEIGADAQQYKSIQPGGVTSRHQVMGISAARALLEGGTREIGRNGVAHDHD